MDENDALTKGPGTAIDDARLRFFLEHQDQILEWSAIATEVQGAAEDLLRDIRTDLVADPTFHQAGIDVGTRVSGETPTGPVLYRASWCLGVPDAPDVGIAMGWDGRIDPAGTWPRTNLPYVGILASRHTDQGRAIEETLRERTREVLRTDRLFRPGSYWVLYRPIRSDKDWWRDVPSWRRGLIDELRKTWDVWSGVVDEVVPSRA